MKHPIICAVVCLLVCLAAGAASAKRVALVIGNADYAHTPVLANPANDAADMAAKLRALGFEVVGGENLTLDQLRRTVRDFANRLEGADIGLFFYAGHGVEVDGRNYILPVDARLEAADDLRYETMPMEFIHMVMERKARTSLLFLDACRDNPLARSLARTLGTRSSSIGRGLAQMGAGVGTLIAYATQPGNVALDGKGRNSPFTGALLKHLGRPGEEITVSLRKVRSDVLSRTGGAQVPWENSSLTGEVILKALEGVRDELTELNRQSEADRESGYEIAYWNSIKDTTRRDYFEAYLERFPDGRFAEIARLKMEELSEAAGEEPDAEAASAPAPSEVPAEPETPPPVRAVQARLNALGCDAGPVDGAWGPRSARALARFAAASGASLPGDAPSEDLLTALGGFAGRVCPLVCGDGFEERDGECVAAALASLNLDAVPVTRKFDGVWRYTRFPKPGAGCDFSGLRHDRIEIRSGRFAYGDMTNLTRKRGVISPEGDVAISYETISYDTGREERVANGKVTAKATVDENGFASGDGEYRGVDGCVARVELVRYDGKSRERAQSPQPPTGYDGAYVVDIIRTGDNFRIASMRLSRENGDIRLMSADNRSHGSAGMESTFRGSLGDDGRFRVAVDISYLNRTYRRAHVYGSTQLPSPFAVGRSARFSGPTLGGQYGSEIVIRRIR